MHASKKTALHDTRTLDTTGNENVSYQCLLDVEEALRANQQDNDTNAHERDADGCTTA